MLSAYIIVLILLLIILFLLWNEELRLRKNITHGLASKYWVLRERRRFVRFKQDVKIRYNLKQSSYEAQSTKSVDVSRKGVCLITYEKLKEKAFLELELELPDFSRPVKLMGQVAWTKDMEKQDDRGRRLFSVGIRFLKINPSSEALLLTHLNTLKRP